MSDDIVNRLRTWLYETPVCMEAADEIERLTAENEKLRGLISRNFDAMEVAFGDSPDAAAIREIVNQQQRPSADDADIMATISKMLAEWEESGELYEAFSARIVKLFQR